MKKFWISFLSMILLSAVCIYLQPTKEVVKQERKKRKTLGTIAAGKTSFGASKNGQSREEWQLQRLRDPQTGKLPYGIRRSELEYAKKTLKKTARNDKSSNWLDRGPYNVGGRTRAIALDSRDENTILAGAVSGGLWRSEDAGQNWERITPSTQIQNVTTFVQDTRDGKEDTWYYGTGEAIGNSASGPGAFYLGNGVYKTTDNGETWQSLASTASTPASSFDSRWDLVFRLAIDANDTINDVIYAATLGSILKSKDGGTSWDIKLGEGPRTTAQVTDVLTTSKGTVYATLSSNNNVDRGIWRSADGETWTNITSPLFASVYNRIVMAVNPSNENELYFLANTPGFGQVSKDFFGEEEYNSLWKYTYVSGDGTGSGGIWTDLSTSIPHGSTSGFDNFYAQGSYNMMVTVSPSDSNMVIIGGTNLFRSTDGFRSDSNTTIIGGYKPGTTFPDFQIYPNHHPDNHDAIFLPSNPTALISASDGGVRRTDNLYADTVVWDNLNRGYLAQQLYTVGFNPSTTDDILLGGFQDNGNFFTASGDPKADWVLPLNGDGSYMGIANTDNLYYLSIQRGKIFKVELDDNGGVLSFRRIDPSQANSSDYLFINPFVLDPNNNDLMYVAGGTKLWRNDELSAIAMTNEWDSISQGWSSYTDTVTSTVSAVAVSKTPANVVYYGTSQGQLFKIDDAHTGDPSHQDISSKRIPRVSTGFPNANINSIAIDPRDADKVLIAFSNYRVYSLYYTEDGGVTWMEVAGNIEALNGDGPSCRSVSILPLGPDSTMFLLGTSVGLFTTDTLIDKGTNWEQVEVDRIGNAIVEMVQTRTTDGLIAVATHGNGIFTTKVLVDYTISSIAPSVCDDYKSPSGKTYVSSGSYIDTIPNGIGDDSIIYINLTVNKVDTAVSREKFILESQELNADSYQWIDCINNNTPINGANSKTYEVLKNGLYAVVVSKNNCTDTSRCIEVVDVGIDELSLNYPFNISPNPSKGIIRIDMKLKGKKETLIVRDIEGKEVYKMDLNRNVTFPLHIDLTNLSQGMYFVTTSTRSTKIIITE